jgi:hypothetical protein
LGGRLLRTALVERTGNDKDEIQGSLHCATHDETVSGFGRDDVWDGVGVRGYTCEAALRAAVQRSAQPDTVFADDDEHRQEISHPEKLPDLSTKVDQYQFAACGAGRDVKANQSAEAHAVHVGKVGEVERDSFVIRE